MFKWKLAFFYNWRDEITARRREELSRTSEATEEKKRKTRNLGGGRKGTSSNATRELEKVAGDAARRDRSGGESPLPAERVLRRFKAYSDTGVVYAPNAVI